MKKIEALNYLVDNRVDYDEWSGAGMAEALIEIIKSEEEYFTEEKLKELLDKAYNY